MSTWLSITVIAGAQVLSQSISVIGAIWQERTRAAARCRQMQTAAAGGTILHESGEDGTDLLIVPQSPGQEYPAVEWALSGAFHEPSRP